MTTGGNQERTDADNSSECAVSVREYSVSMFVFETSQVSSGPLIILTLYAFCCLNSLRDRVKSMSTLPARLI